MERKDISLDDWHATSTGMGWDAFRLATDMAGDGRVHYCGKPGILYFEHPEDLAQFNMTYTKPKPFSVQFTTSNNVISIDKSRATDFTAIEVYRYCNNEWEKVS
jgi:hypothetical protein